MAFTYSFVDNEIYGTDDINDIAKCLTGAGVAPFVAKESYSTSDLNDLTAEMISAGVSLDGCICTPENAGTTEMTVTVGQGIVFFNSGVRLIVDADGYVVPVTPNTAGFVYACFSPTLQKADIVFGTELPSDGEYVVLAEIRADGALTDKRVFARSKIATMGRNVAEKLQFVTTERTLLETDGSNCTYIVASIPDVNLSFFNYAMLVSGEFSESTDTPLPRTCFYDLNENRALFSIYDSYYVRNGNVFHSYLGAIYKLCVIDDKLCIVAICNKGQEKNIIDCSGISAIFM